MNPLLKPWEPVRLSSMSKETVSVEIDRALYERMEKLSQVQGLPLRQVVSDALRAYLSYKEKKSEFLRAAEAAWREYQRAGRHVTLEEVEAWMDSWGTEHELPMPTPHT